MVDSQNRLIKYFAAIGSPALPPAENPRAGPVNRLTAYFADTPASDSSYHVPVRSPGYERRRYPEAARTLEEHLHQHAREDQAPLKAQCAKDLVSACNEKTGPVGIVSIPVDESNAELVRSLLVKAQERHMFRTEDVIQINHGVVQFSGFVADKEGLDRVYGKIKLLLRGEEGVGHDRIRPKIITPQRASFYRRSDYKPRVAYELLDLALGADIHCELKEHNPLVFMTLPPGYHGSEVQDAYLDDVHSIHPLLLGSTIRAAFTHFSDPSKTGVVYVRRDDTPTGQTSLLSTWEPHAETIVIHDDEVPLPRLGLGPGDFAILSAVIGQDFDYNPARDALTRRDFYLP